MQSKESLEAEQQKLMFHLNERIKKTLNIMNDVDKIFTKSNKENLLEARAAALEHKNRSLQAEVNYYRERNMAMVNHLSDIAKEDNKDFEDMRRRLTNCEKALADRNAEIKRLESIIGEQKSRLKTHERTRIDLYNAHAREQMIRDENRILRNDLKHLREECSCR